MQVSISRNGVTIGTWPEETVRAYYAEGRLLPTDYYWKEGMADWAELSSLFPPNPLPPIPAPPLSESTALAKEYPKFAATARYEISLGILLVIWLVLELASIIGDSHLLEPYLLIPIRILDVIAILCFIRYQVLIYGWWKGLGICALLGVAVFFFCFLWLLVMGHMYGSIRAFRQQLADNDLKIDWLGHLSRPR